jgi:hypothetical protein
VVTPGGRQPAAHEAVGGPRPADERARETR